MPESKSPVLEPHTQAFIDALTSQGGEPLYKLSYPAARKVLEDELRSLFPLKKGEIFSRVKPKVSRICALHILNWDT
jgi:hypothetical protein